VVYHQGRDDLWKVQEGITLAEGVRIQAPYRMDALLEVVRTSSGSFVRVKEEDILSGQRELAHRGFFVEPTSAIVWSGLIQSINELPEPIVVVLTGSGLKTIG
jgi:threonine synthase